MGSLHDDSLFTNTPLEETIDICTNTLFENTEKVEGLRNFYLLLQKNPFSFLKESSASKLIKWLWVHL